LATMTQMDLMVIHKTEQTYDSVQ